MRILKATFVFLGGLVMTAACFQPWVQMQWSCLHRLAFLSPCPVGQILGVYTTTVSLWDISQGHAYGIGLPSAASAIAIVGTSVVLMVFGCIWFFARPDINNTSVFLHPLLVLWAIVNASSISALGASVALGSGVGVMIAGWVLAGIGIYLIRPREVAPQAKGTAAS